MLMRNALDYAVQTMLALKRDQRIRPHDSTVAVNLGSGLAVAPGWINIDSSLNTFFAAWPEPVVRAAYRLSGSRRLYTGDEYVALVKGNRFVQHDLCHSIPFDDNAVDYLYSSHFLEHIPRESARRLIREAYRVLKPGGRMRLCLPDLERAVCLYRQGAKEAALDLFFVPGADGRFGRHQYMYDFEMVRELLHGVGFRTIERCACRQGLVPDIDTLDNRPEQTLFVEAVK